MSASRAGRSARTPSAARRSRTAGSGSPLARGTRGPPSASSRWSSTSMVRRSSCLTLSSPSVAHPEASADFVSAGRSRCGLLGPLPRPVPLGGGRCQGEPVPRVRVRLAPAVGALYPALARCVALPPSQPLAAFPPLSLTRPARARYQTSPSCPRSGPTSSAPHSARRRPRQTRPARSASARAGLQTASAIGACGRSPRPEAPGGQRLTGPTSTGPSTRTGSSSRLPVSVLRSLDPLPRRAPDPTADHSLLPPASSSSGVGFTSARTPTSTPAAGRRTPTPMPTPPAGSAPLPLRPCLPGVSGHGRRAWRISAPSSVFARIGMECTSLERGPACEA